MILFFCFYTSYQICSNCVAPAALLFEAARNSTLLLRHAKVV